MDLSPESRAAPPAPALPCGQAGRYAAVRAQTRALAAPLSAEDCTVQSMPDASPVKGHLAHTTRFFETFVLAPHLGGYRPLGPAYRVLFNSCHHGAGERHPRPERGMSAGWDAAQAGGWCAPLYRECRDGRWCAFTLEGEAPLDPLAPACHVSWYEADAFARRAGARLPTEAEWETAAGAAPVEGNFLDSGALHPQPPRRARAGHLRASYRNCFPPAARWQFSGLRLARDAG